MNFSKLLESMTSALNAYGIDNPKFDGALRGIVNVQANQFIWLYAELTNSDSFQSNICSRTFPLNCGVDPKQFTRLSYPDALYFTIDTTTSAVTPIDFFTANRLMNQAPISISSNPEEVVENLLGLLSFGEEKGLWSEFPTMLNPYDWDGWREYFKGVENSIMYKVVHDSILRINDFFVGVEKVA